MRQNIGRNSIISFTYHIPYRNTNVLITLFFGQNYLVFGISRVLEKNADFFTLQCMHRIIGFRSNFRGQRLFSKCNKL